jgi:hypothetical protein
LREPQGSQQMRKVSRLLRSDFFSAGARARSKHSEVHALVEIPIDCDIL